MLKVNHEETQRCAECNAPLWVLGEPNFSLQPGLPHFNEDGTVRMKAVIVCKQCGVELANHWLLTEGE
jgi:uncharacterized protein with PIN domain